MQATLENRIPPPVVTLGIGLAMGAAASALPAADIPAVWRLGSGGALFIAAGLFAGPAIAAFVRAGTTINPVQIDRASRLVTGGIYRVTRNPMYVALALLLLGLALFLGRPWLLVGPLAFVLYTTRFQIRPEERAMQARFGADYDAYRARVRRWL